MLGDLEVLKEIPGYKAILKSVLKSQIQMLVEQLSEHTGEETILLTASLHDGTLSHQGSTTGKGFLEGRDEIKSQFLGYCLKSHHKKKSTDTRPSPYQRPQTSGRISPALGSPSKKAPRLQVQPVSLQRVVPAENTGTPNSNKRPADVQGAPSQVFTSDSSAEQSSVSVKLESNESGVSSGDSENLTTTATFPSSIHQNHTLTAGEISASENNDSQNNADDYTEISTMNDDSSTANTCIKIEPITENEMELEITGVEPGKVNMQSDSWSHSPCGFGITPTSVVEASSFSNETNDSSYIADYSNFPIEEPVTQQLRLYQRKNIYPKPKVRKILPKPVGLKMPTEQGEWKYLRKCYSCPFCEKNWRTPSLLQRHLLTHTGERPHICIECGHTFKQKAHLDGHYVRSHKEKLVAIVNESDNNDDCRNTTSVSQYIND